ncbi:hypothetical protein BOTBODRAFT_465558 [Botryobasidium botryosum FD-172 SS1]|uniref:Uncharacterized protein n=1 Tax=Botryobasidium botryosum (strain FD-172 SS1) TaxID=930990 RepID=A0A067M5M5_BOTB1|nr:hypothetical protein BOTBODRAFT_465558 [Botryobasidium botryosum FD-172 SS1]
MISRGIDCLLSTIFCICSALLCSYHSFGYINHRRLNRSISATHNQRNFMSTLPHHTPLPKFTPANDQFERRIHIHFGKA